MHASKPKLIKVKLKIVAAKLVYSITPLIRPAALIMHQYKFYLALFTVLCVYSSQNASICLFWKL